MISLSDFGHAGRYLSERLASGLLHDADQWRWQDMPHGVFRHVQGSGYLVLQKSPPFEHAPLCSHAAPASSNLSGVANAQLPHHHRTFISDESQDANSSDNVISDDSDSDVALLPLQTRQTQQPVSTLRTNAAAAPPQRSYTFTVSYSASYAVPVFHFTACKEDGLPLTVMDIAEDLPSEFRLLTTLPMDSTNAFLTPQVHPVTGLPCFGIHPCRTAELLDAIIPSSCAAAASPTTVKSADECPQKCDTVSLKHSTSSCGDCEELNKAMHSSWLHEPSSHTGTLSDSALRYLLAWFSVVPSAVGLRLPLTELASR